ncbi:PqiC family protein [Aestuariispira insulae]|uniref:ABC-type transport auxiliary lipoprotein component domain-containing protein n=1 Tax=Aestuariispira insulae TaxID=1461337 RepID=A0A3D9HF45_9PROT|nr:PqiC family protein [Aestuariispira insulae]RED48098.1 hypothetical protein DFP90_108116 [Aestuariispira insulae]
MISKRLFIALAAVLLLAGCVGSPSQPTRFYMLSAGGAEQDGPPLSAGKAVLLGPVTLPGYLDRPQLVTHTSDNKLALSELDQWAEPLHDNLKRVLIDNLSAALETEQVYAYPASLRPGPDVIQITLDIAEVRFSPTGDVSLKARWSLFNSLDGKPRLRDGKIYQSQNGGGHEDNAAALSNLVLELAGDLATAARTVALASS